MHFNNYNQRYYLHNEPYIVIKYKIGRKYMYWASYNCSILDKWCGMKIIPSYGAFSFV